MTLLIFTESTHATQYMNHSLFKVLACGPRHEQNILSYVASIFTHSILINWAGVGQGKQHHICTQQRLRSTQSDQSLLSALWVVQDPNFPQVDSEDSDKTWHATSAKITLVMWSIDLSLKKWLQISMYMWLMCMKS